MKARDRLLIFAVGLGVLLNPFNSSMISVAIPNLQQLFQLNYTEVSWVIFCFYIASTVAQPIMGRASDLVGRRKIFLTGLIVSLLTSLLAPLSPSFGWLILFRTIQAVGTSMMLAVGMAMIKIHITEKQAAALAFLAIFLNGAAAIGPFVGGMLIHWWSWQAIFFVNIPILLGSIYLSWRYIPRDGASASITEGMSLRKWFALIDVSGIVLFAGGLVALLLGILSANSTNITVANGSLILIGAGLLTAFVVVELKSQSPFIPLRAFMKYPAMTWVNVEYILVNMLFYSLFFGIPAYLQIVRQVSEFETGILMLSLGLCSLFTSPLAGRWIDKAGPKPALLTSGLLMTLGSVLLVSLKQTSPVISVCFALAAFGIGSGLNGVGLQTVLFQSTPKEIIGVASGLFNTSRYIGTIGSSLLIGFVMGETFNFEGFRVLGFILILIALCLVVISLRRVGLVKAKEGHVRRTGI